ncbi:MAG: hypothetical protein IJ812_00210 [Schwartzia sp.]|nr:hypothetical protein [Schwartzia sp. (in: firmicutes)]MBR1760148.1 hypothetical protein [Schwartzia sp. (in: firmicutes)]MBR1884805.1 hypothetical protein [Schwartzia sp. (in: firmicutes)]
MNKKAEQFQDYLKEKDIENVFAVEERDDELHTALFRSQIDVDGNKLPTVVIFDDSIYGIVRVLVAPKALNESNELAVLKIVNGYNKQYKPLKYFCDDAGALLLDVPLVSLESEHTGDMVYAMFDVIIRHLGEAYKDIMRSIWA